MEQVSLCLSQVGQLFNILCVFDEVVILRRSRFTSCHALHLLSLLLPAVYRDGNGKSKHTPLGVVYDMVLSHSEFIGVMCSSCDQKAKGLSYLVVCTCVGNHSVTFLESLVELLVSVVELCPSVCKTSHILTFLSAYSATTSRSGTCVHCGDVGVVCIVAMGVVETYSLM